MAVAPDFGYDDLESMQMGPRKHLREERVRLSQLEWKHFELKALGSTLGAEIHGLDLRTDVPQAVFDEVLQALWAYKVIFFRGQRLDPAEQVRFAQRFGELEEHPFIPANDDHPELVRLEKSEQVGGYENVWHHDVTWREVPSKLAILHAVAVPDTGGDTLFADMEAAYQGLDDEWKARVADMTLVHDYMRAFGAMVPKEQRQAMRERYPQVEHPAVGRHAQTGKPYLYCNRAFVDHVKGMSRAESVPVIEHLSRQSESPEYQCRFHWEPDSIAIWDNRAVQHYAASDYWPDRRVMERASVVGERPQRA